MDRAYLKSLAAARLRQNRWPAVGVMFIATLLAGVASGVGARFNVNLSVDDPAALQRSTAELERWLTGPVLAALFTTALIASLVGLAYQIFLGNVISIGKDGWFLRYNRGENASVGALFDSFKIYKPAMITGLLRSVYIFLWSLLFVIPGIVMGYAYSMAGYVIYENPNLTASQALDISKRMTRGYKGDLFVLDLSFIGWNLLSSLTLGLVGIFHANPYYAATHAHFYENLKQNALATGAVTPEEFGMPTPAAYPTV